VLTGEETFELDVREIPFEQEDISQRSRSSIHGLHLEALVDLFLGAKAFPDRQFAQQEILTALHDVSRGVIRVSGGQPLIVGIQSNVGIVK
jgi:hypothetical protein